MGGANVAYIDRGFHKADGVEEEIRKHFPGARFITVEHLTEGQASTCLLAKDIIDNEDELLIAGCDNGMAMDEGKYRREKETCDVLVFTYRHNEAVLEKPEAYGWVKVDGENRVTGVSIKKPISDTPMEDHAIVATFWFRHGADFVRAAEKMIRENDRVNGEFYVDTVIRHALDLGLRAKAFEIGRYIGWGTPKDYEAYEATIAYWRGFVRNEKFLPGAART